MQALQDGGDGGYARYGGHGGYARYGGHWGHTTCRHYRTDGMGVMRVAECMGVMYVTEGMGDTPHAGTTRGDAGPTRGDAGPTRGDAGTTRGDAGTTRGDAGTTRGDAGTTRGDAGTTRGDEGTTAGDTGTTGGDTGTTRDMLGYTGSHGVTGINIGTVPIKQDCKKTQFFFILPNPPVFLEKNPGFLRKKNGKNGFFKFCFFNFSLITKYNISYLPYFKFIVKD